MNEPYEFIGKPIVPKIVASLALKLFNGEQVASRRIAENTRAVHLERGGLPGNAENMHDVVKKAMRHMKKNGLATFISKGIWQIGVSNPDDLDDENDTDDGDDADDEDTITEEIASPGLWPSPRIVGTGAEAIYIYYFPEYKKQAIARNERSWRCKIGRSTRDAMDRIRQQVTTSMPEFPETTVFLTEKSGDLEKALHAVLTLRGQKALDTPGNEWFVTSPEEVLELIHVINPAMARSERG